MNTIFVKSTLITGSQTASCGGNQYTPTTNCPRAEGVLRIGTTSSGSISLAQGGTINLGDLTPGIVFHCRPTKVIMTAGSASILEV